MVATAAVILAAGLGTRFGGRKLLAPINGRPMLQHVLDLAAAAELAPVVVVLGTDADELLRACEWHAARPLFNSHPEHGISGSVRIGLAALSATSVERAVVLLGDQPFLAPEQLALVLERRAPIVVPRYAGAPGNPVLLERSVWSLSGALEGDRGFAQLFEAHSDLVAYVDLPGSNPDIDTAADLRRPRSAG